MISQTNSICPGSPLSAMILAQLLQTTTAVSAGACRGPPGSSPPGHHPLVWMYAASFHWPQESPPLTLQPGEYRFAMMVSSFKHHFVSYRHAGAGQAPLVWPPPPGAICKAFDSWSGHDVALLPQRIPAIFSMASSARMPSTRRPRLAVAGAAAQDVHFLDDPVFHFTFICREQTPLVLY